MFGCWVYVLPPHATRCNMLCTETCTGIFLGYSQTMKNILYYDLLSHQVKTALHLVFDEAMTDLDNKTPNVQLLRGDNVLPKELVDLTFDLQNLDISSSLFTALVTVELHYDPTDSVLFGFHSAMCTCLHQTYITNYIWPPIDYMLWAAWQTLLGSYVVSISDIPLFLWLILIKPIKFFVPLTTHNLWQLLLFLHLNVVHLLTIIPFLLSSVFTIYTKLAPYNW